MKRFFSRKVMVITFSLLFIAFIAGCSVTPDVPAPDPVPAPEESPGTADAPEAAETTDTTAPAAEATIEDVRIVTEDYPPYNFINEDGDMDGIGYQQVRAGLNQLNLDVEIEVLPWSRAYEMAQQEDNVLIFSMTRTEARENMFKWISPLAQSDVYLYALRDRMGEYNVNSLEDAKNHVISAMQDDFTQETLLAEGFEEGVNLSSTPDMAMGVTQVFRGQTDFFISSSEPSDIAELVRETEYDANDLVVAYNIEEMRSYLYIAASMGTPDHIVQQFRDAIPGIEKD
ncbi:amino acid ABC transporter substrate-binding protein, PAAT family [Tindallia magadiensis]|uniref:Amino acid ABC transporter substrate-binding protein, PAAT family n=1 Tax=Tindallia magadiensis TaxID=69895 RepID=A0A1I3E7E8_9FIRM|nr:transporter substrate-binding domain-containing protein [Tindallia magadiensis]SFH94884.1 amino acid ABC transporter substrate-binding protein, PAAT family [Tindallia magadiensis]